MAVLAKLGNFFRSSSKRRSLSRSSSSSSSTSSKWSSVWEECYDSDDEVGLSVPADIPQGCMAVIVGSCEKRRRFVIGTHLLTNPVFGILLQSAAEEYGYRNSGALEIPCDPVLFEHFVWLLENDDPAAAMLEVNDLMAFYS